MDSSQKPEQSIQLYITLSKMFYTSGDVVEGIVYINCRKDHPQYKKLHLLLQGKQKILWSKSQNHSTVNYTNLRQTYHEELKLNQFQDGIISGQYGFPFLIILPALPSSFHKDGWNYIEYSIQVVMLHINPNEKNITFKKGLQIRQTFRGQEEKIKIQKSSQPSCSFFCCLKSAQLNLQADVTYLQINKSFTLQGSVDSLAVKELISHCKLFLKEQLILVADSSEKKVLNEEILLCDFKKKMRKRDKTVQIEVKVPSMTNRYTAIGNILSRTYFLLLKSDNNCFHSSPDALTPVILRANQDLAAEKDEKMQVPEGWDPVKFPQKSFTSLRPYIYLPSPSLKHLSNRGTLVNVEIEMGSPTKIEQQLKKSDLTKPKLIDIAIYYLLSIFFQNKCGNHQFRSNISLSFNRRQFYAAPEQSSNTETLFPPCSTPSSETKIPQ